MRVVIVDSARKHGYNDRDIRHALRNQMFQYPPKDDGIQMIVGPSASGEFLEIGLVRNGDGALVVVHAMKARKKYLRG